MKTLLVDYISFSNANLTLTEGKETGGRMKLKGKLQEAEVKNGNGRVYPRETLEKEVNKYIKNLVESRGSMGELDHPESSIINLNNVSHLITKIWWEGNNVMGELELLNTPSGKIAQELILNKIPVGISSRAMGSVKQMGESVEVQDDLELVGWDLVSVPSTPNAYMTLTEGLTPQFNSPYTKVNNLITDILCSQSGVCPCLY